MASGVLGTLIDEQRALGFTVWRAACRTAGFSPGSIATFTLDLLPNGVLGALLGALIVLMGGLGATRAQAGGALAAHSGCLLAMPAGVMLCATGWPLPLTLAAELALTIAVTLLVWNLLRPRCRSARTDACLHASDHPHP
jgi:hypothetical protein